MGDAGVLYRKASGQVAASAPTPRAAGPRRSAFAAPQACSLCHPLHSPPDGTAPPILQPLHAHGYTRLPFPETASPDIALAIPAVSTSAENMTPIPAELPRFLWLCIKPQKWHALTLVASALICALLRNLAGPYFYKQIVDTAARLGGHPDLLQALAWPALFSSSCCLANPSISAWLTG